MLALERDEVPFNAPMSGLSLLHFAPEQVLGKYLSTHFGDYTTADLFRDDVDKTLNIEEIDEPDNSFDVIVASHILEHVDDLKAAREVHRVLRTDGLFIAMVPIVEGWDTTYENLDVRTNQDRLDHFGQANHVRFYGSDFTRRIERSGLKSEKQIVAFGEDCPKYGLARGEKIFVFQKAV